MIHKSEGPKPVTIEKTPVWPAAVNPKPIAIKTIKNVKDHNVSLNRKLVLDTAAFIDRIDFSQYASEFYTIPEVLKEVRDGKARNFYETLQFEIKAREPTRSSYEAIVEFSKMTGDFATLSKVDLKVLALAHTLEIETHQGSAEHLRSTPITAELQTKPASTEVYLPKTKTEDQEYQEEDDDQEEEEDDENDDSQNKHLVGFGDFDSDDEDGWINQDNIRQYTKTFLGREEAPPDSEKQKDIRVSVLTADFAIQNVLLQLGMHLTSVDGVTIKQLRQWILRCFTCSKLCRDMEKLFCPHCGKDTLLRVQCTIDNEGNFVISNLKPKVSTRGTIYNIPNRKSGHKAKNLILSQSELPSYMSHQKAKAKLGIDGILSEKKPNPKTKVVVGYGKRNPNEVRPSTGRKK